MTYASNAYGPGNIFWQAADGSSPAEPLLPPDYTGNGQPVSWSPDGKTLAFEQWGPGIDVDVMLLFLEDEDRTVTPFLQSEFRERLPTFSPDGRWMAYIADETGRDEVYVRPFPASTGKWLVSTQGGGWPRWNPNGRELFYRSGLEVHTDVMWVQNFRC